MKIYIIIIHISMLFIAINSGIASDLTGRDIMLKMDNVDNSQDRIVHATMTIERGSEKLTRRIESLTKKYGDTFKDDRTLIRFIDPADVRGTLYLTWSWDDINREDDMWIYIPAESLVRRISGSGRKGSFMRSDLANEDLQIRSVDEDIHTLIKNTDINGIDCWVIESIPKKGSENDTHYSKRITYVRKDIFLPTKVDYYDKGGHLLKTATHGGFRQIDSIWTATKSLYETPGRGTRTMIDRTEVQYNKGLDDGLFLQSNLKR